MKTIKVGEFDTVQSKPFRKRNKKIERMLFLMLFLIFFSTVTLRSQEYLPLYIGISLFICLYGFFRCLRKPLRIDKTLTNGFTGWLILVFLIYFLYGIFLPKYSFFDADYFAFMFIMTILTITFFIDIPVRLMMEIFIKVCAFTSMAVCVFIIINEWFLIIAGGTRIGESGSGNVNTVAIFLGTMSIPCIYKIIFEKKYRYLVPYGLSTVIMLMTGSKKALLFIILGIFILSIMKNKIKIHKYLFVILLIILTFIIIFKNDYLYNIIGARTIDFIGALGFNIKGASYSNSTTLRLTMYKVAFEAFMSRPLFGGGWFYFSEYSGLDTYSHNNYLELLCNYGIVGFTIYYSMFLIVLIKLKRMIKLDNNAKLIFTILLIIVIVDAAVVSFSFNLLNYMVLALGYLYAKVSKNMIVDIMKSKKGVLSNEKFVNSH